MVRCGWLAIVVLTAAGLAAREGAAAPVFIDNADFERLPTSGVPVNFSDGGTPPKLLPSRFLDYVTNFGNPNGAVNADAVPGWQWVSGSGSAGQQRNVAASFLGPATNGPVAAYSNGGTLRQTLGVTIEAGTYTLLVDVGRPNQGGFVFNYSLALLGGSNQVLASVTTPTTPAVTQWGTASLIVPVDLANPLIGTPLVIELDAVAAQTDFDNVRLDFVPIPEASSVALLGWALFALRRRPHA